MNKKTLLIDADSLCFSREGLSYENAIEVLESKIQRIKESVSIYGIKKYKFYLTIGRNFRFDILPSYKDNRNYSKRDPNVNLLKNYLVEKYKAKYDITLEADDLVCDEYRKDMNNNMIASIDKDLLLNLPGCHLNLMKLNFINISEEKSIDNFYQQVIKGDSIDNIPNLLPKVGDKRLEDLLELSGMSYKEISYYICHKLNINYRDRYRLLYCGCSTNIEIDEYIHESDNDIVDKFIKFSKGEIKYQDIKSKKDIKPKSLPKRSIICYDEVIDFGKYKGTKFTDLYDSDKSYFNWLYNTTLNKGLKYRLDIILDEKQILTIKA